MRLEWIAFLVLCAGLTACGLGGPTKQSVDLLITGGTVYTGDPEPGRTADVAIVGSRIMAVDENLSARFEAVRIINAEGLIVAPGLIDPHTHAQNELVFATETQLLEHYLFQGVTTVVTGNDGGGPLNVAALSSRLGNIGIGPNISVFIGHNTVRREVMGLEDRAPTPTELDAMRLIVRTAMEEGALGLSSGLYYTPGAFAETVEVVALAAVAAEFGGVYDTHLRDESSYSVGLVAAVEEALDIGRQSGAHLHIAHIKALGADVWGESERVIAKVEAAQAEGVSVSADQYPWPASGTRLGNALLPNWAKADGADAIAARLAHPETRSRIEVEMVENLRRRGGPEAILLVQGEFAGQTLENAARYSGMTPIALAIDLILAGDVRIASFNMQEDDIERFMVQPWVVTSSDGTTGHPRKFASFPRKYQLYVLERGVLDLSDFIHRSSSLTADILGLCGRGRLLAGQVADIVIFDPEGFKPRADFNNASRLSVGVVHLFVNGVAAIANGALTGEAPGQFLARDVCPQPVSGLEILQ